MKKNLSMMLCAVFVLLCVGACGNKGDLYMPKEAQDSPNLEQKTEKKKTATETSMPQTQTEDKEDGVS